jgi:hypothetical protein
MLLAAVILTSSLAFAQASQDLSILNATNQNGTNQNATVQAANLIGSESSISKPVYDIESFARKKPTYNIESFARIKPVYDTSMLSRNIKPLYDVSQRAFLPARFSYTMAVLRPTFNLSQRGGQLSTRFIYNAAITKTISNVSAYSAIKPFYDIGQYSRINPDTISLHEGPINK